MALDFFNNYPYTDFHELNLDWIISALKALQDSYADIIEWIENDAQNFNNLVDRLDILDHRCDELNNQIGLLRLQTDLAIDQLRSDLNAQYVRITTEYQALFNTTMSAVQSELVLMDLKIEQYKRDLIQLISDNDSAVMDYVHSELQLFIDNLPDYENLIIYNPVRGIQTNVQTAINDLYGYFNLYALTAQEYDDLQLSADEYDRYELTAHLYDSEGRLILGTNSYYMMRSPFTGEMAPVSEVVLSLFELHRSSALTASAYDALDMTASYYDGLLVEALDYDLNGI